MNSFIILELFLNIFLFQIAQTQTVDHSNYQCTEVGEIQKGDNVVICIHVDNNKLSYFVEVDKYSALQLNGAYTLYKTVTTDVNLYAQIGDQITKEGVTYGGESVVSVFSVVIRLDSGVIKEITWDNGCFGACDQECVENIGCSGSCVGDGLECDPKIYVSWIGTDSSGLHMTSSGLRLSEFASYSIKRLYDSAKEKIKQIDA